jgi:hypothetical protein
VDKRDKRMEERPDTDSPPSYGRAAMIYPDCSCGADGGEYCHCAERCTRGAGKTCEFVRTPRTCLTHKVICLGCRVAMHHCQCHTLPVLLRHAHDMEGADRPRNRGATPLQHSNSYEEAAAIQNKGGADDTMTEDTAVAVRPTRRGARGGQVTHQG